jgi:hypothetical protein
MKKRCNKSVKKLHRGLGKNNSKKKLFKQKAYKRENK